MVLIYWIVFGHVVRLNIAHYPLFVAAGVMPWMYFNTVVNDSMRALRNNSGIIRTINVPREIFPLAITGQALIEYLLSLPIVFLMGFGYGVWPSRFIVLLPVAAAIETILVVGIGLLLAAINTLVRDTTKVIRPIIRILFYLSPIVYPASRVHAGLALTLYKLNPIVGITELNRLTWYPHYLIAPSTIFQHALISLIGALLFFGVGWAVFVRVEPLALKEL
jgi:ABC-2 type transport system permease protein